MGRGTAIATLSLIAVCLCLEARAEVRVVTDRRGAYRMTQVLTNHRMTRALGGSHRTSGAWRPVRRGAGSDTLNPRGDHNGDLWPLITESNKGPHLPWVVWSRRVGAGFKLAWSRWTPSAGWRTIHPVVGMTTALGDELDPDLAFDREGRPYLVWWREEGGRGTVYLSLFLDSQWMRPYRVSKITMDARYPRLDLSRGVIRVRFDTQWGGVEQLVVFNKPTSITDDINPLDYLSEGDTTVQQNPR